MPLPFDDLLLDYCKRDVEATLKLHKEMQLKEACNDLYKLFKELTNAGFNETQAFTMIAIMINKN